MNIYSEFREPVRVLWHGEGGLTYVSVVRYEGNGLAGGEAVWDLPTTRIPSHLRAIGSRFLVIRPCFSVEGSDTPDDIRRICATIDIQELPPHETSG